MGAISILLLVGALNGAVLAGLVLSLRTNRTANAFLAALIGLVSLRVCIYVLGFAGAYDAHPWLTFAPLDLSFAFGPLLWLYVTCLCAGAPPPRWGLHLSPAGAQLAYSLVCFALPLQAKWSWYSGAHLHFVGPMGLVMILGSGGVYLVLAWRRYAAYQRWLDDHFGNREDWRLGWLRLLLFAFAALLASAVAFAAWDRFVSPLDYFHRTPVVLGFCGLTYVLGLLGWRHGGVRYPHDAPPATEQPAPPAMRVDYVALAGAWRRRVEAECWWQEEAITLSDLARRLGVSERTLSRGLRDGAGLSFNTFVNTLRVEAVQRALLNPGDERDLLTIGMDCGFNSKASFNRAFKAATGQTPSGWRGGEGRREFRQSATTPVSEAT